MVARFHFIVIGNYLSASHKDLPGIYKRPIICSTKEYHSIGIIANRKFASVYSYIKWRTFSMMSILHLIKRTQFSIFCQIHSIQYSYNLEYVVELRNSDHLFVQFRVFFYLVLFSVSQLNGCAMCVCLGRVTRSNINNNNEKRR